MHSARTRIALLAGIVVAGCRSDSTAPTQDPCLVGTQVTVVAMAPAARFSWEPCGMSVLYVRAEAGGTTWWIEADTNSIQSPITYGVVPAGSAELAAPTALQDGVDYRVTIVRRRGPRLNDLTAVGAAVFTFGRAAPPPVRPSQWRFADSRSVIRAAGFGLPLQRGARP